LLTRKFSKFLKKKGKYKNQQRKRYTKKVDNSSNFTSFGCSKQGHIKVECLSQSHKIKSMRINFGRVQGRERHTLCGRKMVIPLALLQKREKKKKQTFA